MTDEPDRNTAPRVFISYSHDSPEHVESVLNLSDRLRADGIDCHVDQYEMFPQYGWPRWMMQQIENAAFVLVVCTETYNEKFRGKCEVGKGLGVKWEGAIVTQEIYESEAKNKKFLPVTFSSNDQIHIPIPLRSAQSYVLSTAEDYEILYRHLTDQPRVLKPDLGPIRPMPPLKRNVDTMTPGSGKQHIHVSKDISTIINRFDQSLLIKAKTHDFVGRKFIFDKINEFIESNPRGYFVVRGDPGIGKTSLAAQYVKTAACVHHFNKRTEGITSAESFLKNLCAQLIGAYALDYTKLPAETGQDAGILETLLRQIGEKLSCHGRKLIIVVDALDEADHQSHKERSNTLYLPRLLPAGVYFILTERQGAEVPLYIECEYAEYMIEPGSRENSEDVAAYLNLKVQHPGVASYIAKNRIGRATFIDRLQELSQGNFMYLHYVIPEIANGAYTALKTDALPKRLEGYYKDHWRRMWGKDKDDVWFKYKLPVVLALTAVPEPVSIERIKEFSGVTDDSRISEVIREWRQFLHVAKVPYKGNQQSRYCLYHLSFYEFLKNEVKDDLLAAEARMTHTLWRGYLS